MSRVKEKTAVTESAQDRARRLWNGDPEDTARKLLQELFSLDQEEAVEILVPWISDRVRATMRTAVHNAENSGKGTTRQARGRTAVAYRDQTGQLPSLSFQKMLTLPVIVPGKRYVLWKDMTIKDHEARITGLEKDKRGIQLTIRRHEWAIREIMAHEGATCLGDIPLKDIGKDFP